MRNSLGQFKKGNILSEEIKMNKWLTEFHKIKGKRIKPISKPASVL